MRGNESSALLTLIVVIGCTPIESAMVAPAQCAPGDQACIAESADRGGGGSAAAGIDGAAVAGTLSNGANASGDANGANGNASGNGASGNGASGNASGNGASGNGASGNASGNGASGAGNGADGSDAPAQCGNSTIEMGETCDPPASCPTAATCKSMNTCLKPMILGDPQSCNARCEMVAIEACSPGDGCCPKACNAMLDSDCSASCGDGVVDVGETCEPTSPAMPCPASCDDMDPCTKDLQTGSPSQCNVACTNTRITAPAPGDQCCPPGAHKNNDTDCEAMCGNNVKEPGETCDGDCPASCDDKDPCTADTMMGSAADCTIACKNTPITTPKPDDGCCPDSANSNNDSDCSAMCGNSVKEGSEKCDGSDCPTSCDDGKACTKDTLVGSAAKCTAECTHTNITSPARGDGCCPPNANSLNDNDCEPHCGNGVMESGEKCDGASCALKTCTPLNRCSTARPTGSASTCDLDCVKNDVTPCCGDGRTEGSETCDGDCDRITCDAGSPCKKANRTGSNSQCNVACGSPTIMGTNGGQQNICRGCNALKFQNPGGGDVPNPTIGGTCAPISAPECRTAGTLYCVGTEMLSCRNVKTSPDDCTGNELQDDDCDGAVDEATDPMIGCPPKGDF